MTRRAMIARADNGGLANMLYPLAKNVKFDKILVVFAGHTTRGKSHPERYHGLGEVVVVDAQPRATEMEWVTNGVDVLYTAETWYHPFLLELARRKGVKTIIHAMPELWAMHEAADEVWAPTPWRTDVLPARNKLVPVPVDRELLVRRQQDISDTSLIHVSSNAMADRDGTELVLEMANHLKFECDLTIVGGEPRHEQRGKCHVEWLGPVDKPFWEMWNDRPATDILVQPRRFGGLCLTMQEAAAVGMPIVTMDLNPQRSHLSVFNLVPSAPLGWQTMKGGSFNVMWCDPKKLAEHVTQLHHGPHAVDYLADVSNSWAKYLDWTNWVDEYEKLLS